MPTVVKKATNKRLGITISNGTARVTVESKKFDNDPNYNKMLVELFGIKEYEL